MRFSELRQKEIVNICDGARLGCASDMDLDAQTGRILALIVPSPFRFSRLFTGEEGGIVIPWGCVVRIGDDVLLVEVHDLTQT